MQSSSVSCTMWIRTCTHAKRQSKTDIPVPPYNCTMRCKVARITRRPLCWPKTHLRRRINCTMDWTTLPLTRMLPRILLAVQQMLNKHQIQFVYNNRKREDIYYSSNSNNNNSNTFCLYKAALFLSASCHRVTYARRSSHLPSTVKPLFVHVLLPIKRPQ